jgi:hypothetical protein
VKRRETSGWLVHKTLLVFFTPPGRMVGPQNAKILKVLELRQRFLAGAVLECAHGLQLVVLSV